MRGDRKGRRIFRDRKEEDRLLEESTEATRALDKESREIIEKEER